jgi:hypothetical protein
VFIGRQFCRILSYCGTGLAGLHSAWMVSASCRKIHWWYYAFACLSWFGQRRRLFFSIMYLSNSCVSNAVTKMRQFGTSKSVYGSFYFLVLFKAQKSSKLAWQPTYHDEVCPADTRDYHENTHRKGIWAASSWWDKLWVKEKYIWEKEEKETLRDGLMSEHKNIL